MSWSEKISNENTLEANVKLRELLRTIRKRQLEFLSLVLRKEALENLNLTRRIAESRGRGRPRIKYMDGIRRVILGGLSAVEILQMTKD